MKTYRRINSAERWIFRWYIDLNTLPRPKYFLFIALTTSTCLLYTGFFQVVKRKRNAHSVTWLEDKQQPSWLRDSLSHILFFLEGISKRNIFGETSNERILQTNLSDERIPAPRLSSSHSHRMNQREKRLLTHSGFFLRKGEAKNERIGAQVL